MDTNTDKRELELAGLVKRLQKECVPAPITYAKIIRVYKDDERTLHQALFLLHQGLLDEYHMIPGNGSLSF